MERLVQSPWRGGDLGPRQGQHGRWQAALARAIRTGIAGIAAYKLRAGLTAESLAQFGATLINIQSAPVAGAPAQPLLTEQDVQAVAKLPHVLAASPMRQGDAQASANNRTWPTAVAGVYPEMQTVLNLGVSAILQWEVNNGGVNFHDTVYIPFSTAQRLFGASTTIRQFSLRVDQTSNLAAVSAAATTIIDQHHHLAAGSQQGFQVTDYDHLLAQGQQQTRTIEGSMVLIAAIAMAFGTVPARRAAGLAPVEALRLA